MKKSKSRVSFYFDWIIHLLDSDPQVITYNIVRKRIGLENGFIQISSQLIHKKKLEIFNHYSISLGITKYRYQLMNEKNELIARWDNAQHHPEVSTHPHHLHHKGKIIESKMKTLDMILSTINQYIE